MSLAIILGTAVGLILGLTGAGGSVIAVPLLIWGMGWTLPQAVPTALLAVCAAATFGTISTWRKGIVRYRAALVIAGTGMLTAPLGLIASQRLPVNVITSLFSIVLIFVSLRMIRQIITNPNETIIVRAGVKHTEPPSLDPVCKMNPNTGKLRWTRPCTLAISGGGLLTGFLSGSLGVGGGFVIVPILKAVTNLSFQSAVATSLMAIALTSAGTVAMALAQGQHLPWPIAIPFVAGAILGMLIGRLCAGRVAGPKLQLGFALIMILTGFYFLVRATL